MLQKKVTRDESEVEKLKGKMAVAGGRVLAGAAAIPGLEPALDNGALVKEAPRAAQKKLAELQQEQTFMGAMSKDDAPADGVTPERMLNTARGNAVTQLGASLEGTRRQLRRVPPSLAEEAPASAPAGYEMKLGDRVAGELAKRLSLDSKSASSDGDLDRLARAEKEAHHWAYEPQPTAPEEQLRPGGRISLPVDFPTEGQAVHFKKLKSNASLEVWIEQPSASEGRRWTLWFFVCAMALGAIGVIADRRKSA